MSSTQCTEVRFAGGFITAIVVNTPERKLAKRTSVQCAYFRKGRNKVNSGTLHCLIDVAN